MARFPSLKFVSRTVGSSISGLNGRFGNKGCSFVQTAQSKNWMTTRKFNSSTMLSAVSGSDILASFEGKDFEGNNIAAAMEALANADAVCFDVDSTVIQEEGIVSYVKLFQVFSPKDDPTNHITKHFAL